MTKRASAAENCSRERELGELVWKGETVVIAKAGKPYLDLLPHRPERRERKPRLLKGKISIARDFDVTPPEVIDAFEGRS